MIFFVKWKRAKLLQFYVKLHNFFLNMDCLDIISNELFLTFLAGIAFGILLAMIHNRWIHFSPDESNKK